jgi:hypothetical protein
MIASYLRNFIFIKTKKTAGTSVEVALAEVCGPADIVTPLGPSDEMRRGNGQPVCRNFASDPAIEQELKEALISGDPHAYLRARKKCEFYAHMPAAEIKQHLPVEFWDNACKITVERHPYEKAVSGAYFHYRPRKHPPFPEYLDTFINGGRYASFKLYTIAGIPVIDEFLRQETLQHDLNRVGAKLGFSVPEELARTKISSRKDTRPAQEILSEEQKLTIYEFCRPEFELLGYER